tara:strand:+ start:171 stop:584 length:414 start_codon:yes stop_codon:yes gene_type:complete
MSIISENRSKALWYELTDSDKKSVAVESLKEMSEYDFLKTLTNLHLFKTGVIVFDINCFSRNNEYSIVISDPIDTGFWFTGVSVSRSKALDLNKIYSTTNYLKYKKIVNKLNMECLGYRSTIADRLKLLAMRNTPKK